MFGLQISGGLWSWQDQKDLEIKISSLQVFSYQQLLPSLILFKCEHVSISSCASPNLRNHNCLHKNRPLIGGSLVNLWFSVQAGNPVNKQTNFSGSNQTGVFSPGPSYTKVKGPSKKCELKFVL